MDGGTAVRQSPPLPPRQASISPPLPARSPNAERALALFGEQPEPVPRIRRPVPGRLGRGAPGSQRRAEFLGVRGTGPPQNTPRQVRERRLLLERQPRSPCPTRLLGGIVVVSVLLIFAFKFPPLVDFFETFPILLWTIKFILIMMLAVLLVQLKHRNAYPGMAARTAVTEETILRELQTLTVLQQQLNRGPGRDAQRDRRRRAAEERAERRRQLKRDQATQFVAALPKTDSSGHLLPGSVGYPRPASSGSQALSDKGAEECSICLGRLDEDECCRLECGHVYHHACMASWLVDGVGQSLRCPLCNLVLLEDEEVSSDDDSEQEQLDAELARDMEMAEWLASAALLQRFVAAQRSAVEGPQPEGRDEPPPPREPGPEQEEEEEDEEPALDALIEGFLEEEQGAEPEPEPEAGVDVIDEERPPELSQTPPPQQQPPPLAGRLDFV